MTQPTAHPLDLTVSRIIRAPRTTVWAAWTTPEQLEQWWVPAPARSRVTALDVTPGGAFVTEFSDDGINFSPQIQGCFLAVDRLERLVWTNALVAGWRPAEQPFITASITFADHPDGTEYTARAMHKDRADVVQHEELGFFEGWEAVTRQLSEFAETSSR
jgi:uncharacterized protein YndB with AHSA1/START domain